MAAKKRKKYEEYHGILGNAEDYHVYHMNSTDRLTAFAVGFIVGFLVMLIFFGNMIVSTVTGLIVAVVAPEFYKGVLIKKRFMTIRLQFKDLLESLATSYSAGLNTTQAFKDAYKDMDTIYGSESDICKEVDIICMGLDSNISVDKMLVDWAKRCDVDDIVSFAEVFEVCLRQKSDLRRIVADTRDIINDKIEVEMEIDTILASSKNELNIMIAMPLIIVGALRFMGGGTITSNSPANVLIKIICLAMFAIAYFVGQKITRIKI